MKSPTQREGKGSRFWIVFASLNLALFLAAIELLAVPNALPTIASALSSKSEFVWVGSAYALASTAFLPFSGGLAEAFGRRHALITCVGLFFVGSAICGGAKSMAVVIVGRTVQGLGGGGIQSLSAIILADLVTLEERGLYASVFGVTWSIANFVGPLIGGALASAGAWRWLFYLNLPIAGVTSFVTLIFMDLPTPAGTFSEKIARLDWIGNSLVVGSTTACTLALTWGGIVFPWNSPRVLVPLIVGIVGFCIFVLYEAKLASHPLVPWVVLSNRTSLAGYLQTFFVGVVALGIVYFSPVYFQAIHNASPIRSGVLTLALSALAPASMFAGAMVNKTGRYRPQMWTGWALILIGLGVLSTSDVQTPIGRVIGFLILLGVGMGFNYSTTVFPVQAPHLSVSQCACIEFRDVWGVTIGSAVLQNELSSRLPASFLSSFPGGVSITYSAIPSISSLEPETQQQVKQAFADSLKTLWEVLLGIAFMGALSSLLMRGLPLHRFRDEKWAMKEKKNIESDGDANEATLEHA
ncbi:MFS general substrate transporter [Mycena sanguinolenta]|uniref:MFS general substrate transporter n=1 Tax=Mycena sanguinolenta TaxID=230812 RepID=A0A8H6XHW7_9AGAR|nr:MFS general substrate transporter [Mycena sanguinolenta]